MSLPSLWSLQNEASHGQNARDRSTHASERARSQQQFRRGRRMTLSNFLPLPSITASPVCTPAPSINSTASDKPLSSFIEKILEGSTAQAQSLVEHQTLNAPPQWMSTPPTPPPKLFRRSITFSTGHPSRIVTPSQSSPTISSAPEVIEEFNLSLRRRRSFPAASSPFNQLFATDATSERKANSNITPKIFPMLAKRLKPIFHLHDLTDDENSPTRSDSPNSIDGGSSVIMDDPYAAEKYKDDIRRYYALTELLSTERSYLNDLRALVVVCRQLRCHPFLLRRLLTDLSTPTSKYLISYCLNFFHFLCARRCIQLHVLGKWFDGSNQSNTFSECLQFYGGFHSNQLNVYKRAKRGHSAYFPKGGPRLSYA